MDIVKSLTFQFEDPEWLVKILIGAILVLLGILTLPIIVGFALIFVLGGYVVEVVRNVMEGKETPMPQWDEWGKLFSEGLKFFIIELVWSIPSILFIIFEEIGRLMTNGNSAGMATLGALFVLVFGLLNLAWGVVLMFITPAVMVNFARVGEVSAGFDLSFIFDFVQKEVVNIVIAAVIIWVAALAASIAGLILCLIGIFPALFWLTMVEAHLYGQIGKEYFEKINSAPAELPEG